MKPYETFGLELEGLTEVSVAASSMEYLRDLGVLPKRTQVLVKELANFICAARAVHEGMALNQPDESQSTFVVEGRYEAQIVRDALLLSAEQNPDTLIAGAAQDMLDGYNRALDAPPAEG